MLVFHFYCTLIIIGLLLLLLLLLLINHRLPLSVLWKYGIKLLIILHVSAREIHLSTTLLPNANFLTFSLHLFLNNFFEHPLVPPSANSKSDCELILHLPLIIFNVSIESLLTFLVSNSNSSPHLHHFHPPSLLFFTPGTKRLSHNTTPIHHRLWLDFFRGL